MNQPAIEAYELSKLYDLGKARELAGGWLRRLVGKGRTARAESNLLTALNRVSFTVKQGEAVGIIGANGAGKSTLLKVLTRVTAPSSGHGVVRGRVGTILEVGTGFHAELTGRENVFLSGAILGMPQQEVRAKFDDIIEFAGVEKFVDTPVKRYSSGMYVRLAFAVAAHLDPDILVVDEVLAVGDINFQKRCLQRMEDETRRQGRTILFVSHNLQAIRTLCSRAILLDHGAVIQDGPTSEVIQTYLSSQKTLIDVSARALGDRKNRTAGNVRFSRVWITDQAGTEKWSFRPGESIRLGFEYEAFETVPTLGLYISFTNPNDGTTLSTIKEPLKMSEVSRGERGGYDVTIETTGLRPGSFALSICLGNADGSVFEDVVDSNVNLPFLEIESEETDMHRRSGYYDMTYRIVAA
ncbi:MAG: ABC transporter ATP-binding protein [Pseudolabrys sp.]